MPRASVPSALHYHFEIGEDLSTIHARVCFEGEPPPQLVAGVRYGGELLREARDAASGQSLPVDDHGTIDLRGLHRDTCMLYVADVGSPRGAFGISSRRIGNAMVSNAALWLWRPLGYADIEHITAHFETPAGVDVAVAWPHEGDAYRLDASAFAFYAHAVFGRFERERVEQSGAVFDVAVIAGLSAATRAAIVPWLQHAAASAVIDGKRLPFEHAQILVVPVDDRTQPVTFGHTARGGGRSIALLVSRSASLEALRGDWTLVHELTHLYHPFVRREDLWLREGLATYYQELLRARAGTISEAYAWQRLWDGAAKGQRVTDSLADESARVMSTYEFPLVYWGGAAFALLADVALHEGGARAHSLDEVMVELAHCCAASRHPWTGAELLARMDEIAGATTFTDLAARVVETPPFPDLRRTFADLGIDVSGSAVRLRSNAPLLHVRDAIMVGADIAGARATAQR